jgi:uncharacterized repeat protein (TIGR01451 family)
LLTYSTSQGDIHAVGGTVTATLGQIVSDTAVYVTMVVASQISVTDGTSIINRAYVQGSSAISPTRTVTSIKPTNRVTHAILNRPTLTLTKRAIPASRVKAGERLTYTLTLTAGLEGHVVNSVISDPVPLYTQFVPGSIRLDPPTVGITGATPPTLAHGLTLRAGERAAITFAVTVTAPLTHGTIITNTALVTAPHLTAVAEDTLTHTVIYTPVLYLEKTSRHPLPLSYKDHITYTIVARNHGNAMATGAIIRDPLPINTQYVAGSLTLNAPDGGSEGNNPPLLAHALTLTAGGAATVTFAVTVTSHLTDGTPITNTASLTSTEISRPITATVIDTIGRAPKLHMRKTLSPSTPLQPGNRIMYTIVVSNSGEMNATDALISDTLPTNTTFVPGSITLDPPTIGITGTQPPLLAHNLTIATGQTITVTFAVNVDLPLPNGTHIINTANITSAEVSEPITATVTKAVIAKPILRMHKISSYPSDLIPRSPITYTIIMSNSGNADATGAAVVDPLPAHTAFIPGSLTLTPPTSGITGSYPPVLAHDLTVHAGGAQVKITFAVTVTSPLTDATRITNTATLTSAEVSTPMAATTIDTVSAPVLHLRKTSSYVPPLEPGSRITYTIVGSNRGNIDATGATIYDMLSPHTHFISQSLTLEAPDGGKKGTRPPTLAHDLHVTAGSAATVTFAVTVTSTLSNDTSITNTATFTSAEAFPTAVTVVDFLVTKPSLDLRKSSAYTPPLHPGDRITYTVVACNSGNTQATRAVINDHLPAHTHFVADSLTLAPPDSGIVGTQPPNLAYNLTLATGEAATVTFAVTVTSPLTDGARITNTATLTSAEVSTPITATTVDTISAAPSLKLYKTSAHPTPLDPGDRITYTVIARNSGNTRATGAVINDHLPAHTHFVADSLTLDPPNSGIVGMQPPRLAYNLTLATEEAATVTFAVTVTFPLTDAIPITNTATLTSAEVSTPITATAVDTVSAAPSLKLYKTSAHPTPLHPGDRVTYTIIAHNNGNENATGAAINDPLPANTHFVADSLTLEPPSSGAVGPQPPSLAYNLTLAAREMATVTFAVTVTSPLTDSTPITNTATLTSAEVSTPTVATVVDIVSTTPSSPTLERIGLFPQQYTVLAGERVTYTVLATNSLGYQWDATPEAIFESEVGAGGVWTANTYTSQAPGIWTVTATLQHLSDTATLEVEAPIPPTLYLPLIIKQPIRAPDLVITHLMATQNHITVVLQNVGNTYVVDNFWVDAYVNPDPLPSAPNEIWQDFADQGLAWGITENLAPGATLILTEGNAIPGITYTLVTWPLRIGTPLYAQVDSAYVGQSYGAVLETHEILGSAYNNITGPVNVTASMADLLYMPTPYRRTTKPPLWELKIQLPERPPSLRTPKRSDAQRQGPEMRLRLNHVGAD